MWWFSTTRNTGFSYQNLWGIYWGKFFDELATNISSERVSKSKRVPYTQKRWAWRVVSGWRYRGFVSSESFGPTRKKMLKKGCVAACDWLPLPRKHFVRKLRPHTWTLPTEILSENLGPTCAHSRLLPLQETFLSIFFYWKNVFIPYFPSQTYVW